MATKPKQTTGRQGILQPQKIRLSIDRASFRARIVSPPSKRYPSRMKVLCLSTHREYRDWPTRAEASAILRRGFDALARYQRLGLLRSVRVFREDPRRHYVLFHPDDIEELAMKLRRQDAATLKRNKAMRKLARVGEVAVRR